jgi:3-isopropylmalate/(R)-2-methylmalate dehydratase small subunit
MNISGRIWRFPFNDINTDQIRAYMYSHLPVEQQAEHCLESLDPEFAKNVRPGDVVVAGRNFGCGSSRPAHATFVQLGVAAIIAESFGRLFFRHSLSSGMLVLPVPGILDFTSPDERVEVDTDASEIRNLSIQGAVMPFKPLPSFLAEIVESGGEMTYLQRRIAREKAARAIAATAV